MKNILLITLTLILQACSTDKIVVNNLSDQELCAVYVQKGNNHETAHKIKHCIKAANAGVVSAQYSVAVGYHFSGNSEQALKYYRLAAEKGAVVAFLSLGHMLRSSNENESIYWYKKYINASINWQENGGAGYASLLLAQIFKEKNNNDEMNYWLNICKKTTYAKNCKL